MNALEPAELNRVCIQAGCTTERIASLKSELAKLQPLSPEDAWQRASSQILKPTDPFAMHHFVYHWIFADWDSVKQGPPPAWRPSQSEVQATQIYRSMSELGLKEYSDFHKWSVQNRAEFWQHSLGKLNLRFRQNFKTILNLKHGIENPTWLEGARLNIAESCFLGDPNSIAIVYQTEGGPIQRLTVKELQNLSHRVANSIKQAGFKAGDALAIDMTMTVEAVAIYLGIVLSGCVAISIADSFAPDEIKTRLRIAKAKGIFTQDHVLRAGKTLPLFDKVVAADAPRAIVIPCQNTLNCELRAGDLAWNAFLVKSTELSAVECEPDSPTNILFSSGTTGDPKAIPWTHLTPIKAAVDGYFHHDIQPGNCVAWPTNLGWMMGPWLIYASLLNRGTMALYYGAPGTREFGEFIQNARVEILGLVPSIVKSWRSTECMKGLDWSALKAFSSTGECSNADDYLFLMSLANYRPVIEYCGGTEIGGGFITGTLVQDASPASFSTPALGLDLLILDEDGKPTQNGETFLVPPSIGLSQTLLNRDHHEVYFKDTPRGPNGEILRRHGDQMERLGNGFLRAHGRADDTMNLGGIKVSSAEIERVLNKIEGVIETAAIAVPPPGGGPSLLVIYAVLKKDASPKTHSSDALKKTMQTVLKEDLNPLFKIHEVHPIDSLPRTASNKVMRRVLRAKS